MKKKPKSATERSREYCRRLKEDQAKLEEYMRKDRERKVNERIKAHTTLTVEERRERKRAHMNKYREKRELR